ncbi:TPR repeat-containing protein [Dyadobacter soli]|uniref:TPR repeat-containing protein n=1 Tax=Dyadobacter soli TaxID=659014 RepID=A0A1G7K553_9BACT|nr:tetratricopeptide repeat protein [Dyadobacter soli]SDF32296.1 TPR repeat-containing protein [Dyadobacter soli]
MEFLVVIAFFGYIYYLRNYADLRTPSEKEAAALAEGIKLFESGQTGEAFDYFDARIRQKPKSSIAYLYRGMCQKKLGNTEAALTDFQAGQSYDDQVFTLHLELGKLYLEQNQPEQALAAFNRAVTLSEETSAAPYEWRSKAFVLLGLTNEAEADANHANELSEQLKSRPGTHAASKTPFFDKRLVINMAMIILTSALLLYVINNAESIHMPYLVAVFAAISIGFAEPYKGWLLAAMQCILLVAGYFLFTSPPGDGARQELENFSLYGSMILTFAASFLGGFLKRAFNMK